jgi:putative transposase
MSWALRTKMDERLQFISEHLAGEWPFSLLCERYGISRPTGYKWVDRYRQEGIGGLSDRSSAPHVHGRKTADAIAEALCALKHQHPHWGPKKLVAWLGDHHPETGWPAASTAGEVLKRAGLVAARKAKRHVPPRLAALTQPLYPNHVWAADHKGWIPTPYGARLEPLTVTDGFCRYLLVLSATGSTATAEARPLFLRAFAEYGLPEAIRTDNGSPFASSAVTGLTRLSAEWTRLGIRHERIDPGAPQQNGCHERFHLTLKEAMQPPEASRDAQQCRFDRFRHDFNHERPHEALGQKPPASLYVNSPRPLPSRIPEPVYPAEAAVRKVRSNGEIKWKGELIYIADILAGDAVAVSETEQGQWQVHFYDRPIGIIDPATNTLKAVKPKPKPQPEKEENMTGL